MFKKKKKKKKKKWNSASNCNLYLSLRKGGRSDCSNRRGISLINVVLELKIISKINDNK